MVTEIEGAGTPESIWESFTATASWPTARPEEFGRPLVVAPHPDDEILGVGGLLATIGQADIVAVTDGDASHPDADEETRRDLAQRRPIETLAALDALGVPASVRRLRQPDGAVDEAALVSVLIPLLRPGQHCFATWRGDGHPDHEAVGRAAATACEATGARLWEYPIWMWHWAAPDDPRVPWDTAHRLTLGPESRAAKAAAIAAFTTQITPVNGVTILPPYVLARFYRSFEVVFG